MKSLFPEVLTDDDISQLLELISGSDPTMHTDGEVSTEEDLKPADQTAGTNDSNDKLDTDVTVENLNSASGQDDNMAMEGTEPDVDPPVRKRNVGSLGKPVRSEDMASTSDESSTKSTEDEDDDEFDVNLDLNNIIQSGPNVPPGKQPKAPPGKQPKAATALRGKRITQPLQKTRSNKSQRTVAQSNATLQRSHVGKAPRNIPKKAPRKRTATTIQTHQVKERSTRNSTTDTPAEESFEDRRERRQKEKAESQLKRSHNKEIQNKQKARRAFDDYFGTGEDAPVSNSNQYKHLPENIQQNFVMKRIEDVKATTTDLDDDELLRKWEDLYFEPSSKSRETARKAIEESLKNDIAEKKNLLNLKTKELNKEQNRLRELAEKGKKPNWKLWKKLSNEWSIIQAEIWVWEQEIEHVPLFHPRDNIYAIGIRGDPRYPNQYKYVAVVKDDDDKLIQKNVPLDFLTNNVDADFLEYLHAHKKNEVGWVICPGSENENPYQFVLDGKLGKMVQNIKKPLYQYPTTPVEDLITYIRIKARFTTGTKAAYNIHIEEWAILTEKEKNHEYKTMTEHTLRDIVTPDFITKIRDELSKMFHDEHKANKGKATTNEMIVMSLPPFCNVKDKYDENIHFRFDEKDPFFHNLKWKTKLILGQFNITYPFYFYVGNKDFKIEKTTQQISKICYDDIDEKFYGIHHTKKTNVSRRVEVFPDWIEFNFGKGYVGFLKENPISKTSFLALPIGSARTNSSKQDISGNPVVKYKQDGENVCVFTSLASVLHHLNFFLEAELVDEYPKN